ncbi:MAG: selenide, water dikinase [Acidimicrobiaceae bacterium]|nr:selenide, water dikinase [Acidimicrobiaceae bacterium]
MLRRLTPQRHPDLLVGMETGDDAAVWRLGADRALIVTADFITPVVDDARVWGRIAAVNSASDVYAMGGRPILALNLVAWNSSELGDALLAEVLLGAEDAAIEGGWITVGGHSVDDPEPKFGLVVVGEVHPDRILINAGLRDGDDLVVTKALGTGIVSTAIKAGDISATVAEAAVASMLMLNADAAAAASTFGATGATDVTGFGLLGHLAKMAEHSSVDVALEADAVPILPGVVDLARAGVIPGGTRRNLSWVESRLDAEGTDPMSVLILADAQTSGGLLFGVARDHSQQAVDELIAQGHPAAVIGRARSGTGRIRVRGSVADWR